MALAAALVLGGCDLSTPVTGATPSPEPSFAAPALIPSAPIVRPPQSPPSGAPAPD